MLRRVLATFGNGDCGRLGHNSELGEHLPRIVTALLDLQIKTAAAGGSHTAVIADDGSILTFGLNDRGQLGHNAHETFVPIPQEVPLPEPATAIATGHYHSLAVTESGNVWAWGDNKRGQLGLGSDTKHASEPRLITSLKGANIVSVAAGAEHSLALTRDGEVYSFGSADDGRLGHGLSKGYTVLQGIDEPKPRVIRALQTLNIQHITAGHMHSGVIADNGRVFMFGNSRFNQLGLGKDENKYKPTEIPSLRNAAHLACGGLHTLLTTHDGSLYAFGANQHGCLGLGEGYYEARIPAKITALMAEKVSAGWQHCAAITGNEKLFTWGWGGSEGTALSFQGPQAGGSGQLGLDNDFDYWSPGHVEEVVLPSGGIVPQDKHVDSGELAWKVKHVSCGLNHSVAVIEMEERDLMS